MTQAQIGLTLISCVAFMTLVAWWSFRQTQGETQTRDGYFLAGRNLGGLFIAGSLLLTNLSAEQLIGLNGSAYGFNMSSMAWEVTAALATIAMALIFLPRYLKSAFTTLPEFLNDRFDQDVRRLSVLLFMLGYGLVTIPSVLYSGSIAVIRLFDIPGLFGVTQFEALVITVLTIGIMGSIYAVFGGLKAVAVSDTLNGIGLLIVGIAAPVLGLIALGNGNVFEGLNTVVQTQPEKLNAIGSSDDPIPFGTIFTGMIFANLFYWCTNQYVIQRTLAARNLTEGQKGVLLSGFFKILVPIFMMIPGIIAFHMYGPGLTSIDEAYPALIRDVFPIWMMGFFLAVLFGAVFSSFNSLLNSAATMFTLDIYAPSRRKPLSDRQAVRIAMAASVVIALFSFMVAPMLWFAPEGLWQIIRIFTGFYNIPIVAIVIVGLFARRAPAIGAKIVIGFHVIAYGLLKFAFADIVTLHFLHLYAILFVIEVSIMLAAGRIAPRESAWTIPNAAKVNLTPWRFARPVAFSLMSCVVGLYVVFSPLGFANGEIGFGFLLAIGALIIANIIFWGQTMRYSQADRSNSA
ncbi:MAG: solute:sodium symporter family transporter [Pseudomonadota bacterium]